MLKMIRNEVRKILYDEDYKKRLKWLEEQEKIEREMPLLEQKINEGTATKTEIERYKELDELSHKEYHFIDEKWLEK